MALLKCKECGNEVADSAKACPKCGAPVPKTKWWLWVPLGLIVLFLVFGAIVGNTPEAKERALARDKISYCWDQYNQVGVSPGAKGIMAGGCKILEQRYQERYGVAP